MAGGTITERISLEGGDDVKSQLDGIGAAGDDAFHKLGQAGEQARS